MLIFDTLIYAEKLQKVGVPPEQARVHAEQLKELVENDLATKSDIAELKRDIRQLDLKIEEVRNDIVGIRKDMVEIRKEAGQNQKDVIKWIVGMGLTVILSSTALLFTAISLFAR
ncbi:MAG: hypothetical protein HQM12_08550 [SAR324 cluster bacterium]|nr:hypothetical protein [SAR324 cluster bacterium]